MEKLRKKALRLGATDLKRSTHKSKKWMVKYQDKWIHFGAYGMSDYTIHKNELRRDLFLARARGIRDKEGRLTYTNKNKANYWAIKILWN